jgi:predicted RND superfamily exporter protein
LQVGDMTPGAALLFPAHPYNVAYRLLNEKFLGANQLVVMVDSLRPDGLKEEESLRVVESFSDYMRGAPGARLTMSIADVIRMASRLWHDGDPKWGTIPPKLREQTELLFVFLLSGAANSDRFIDRSVRYASVTTLFDEYSHETIMGALRFAKHFETIDGTARLRFAGGVFGILAAVNEAVESSYWLNLAIIFAVIFLCVNLTYGSWTAAAILMIPVVLSQLAAEAVMVWMHIDLNVNSLPVAAAGAGVGIDYGIYHFSRMIDAYDEIGDLDLAVDEATATTGKAILFTASTMVAATLFWWLSALKFQAEMGMLLAVLMTFNTFGGLVVVPAFVKTMRPRFLLGRKRAPMAAAA